MTQPTSSAQKQGSRWSDEDSIIVNPLGDLGGAAPCEGNLPGPHNKGAEWRVWVTVQDDQESWALCRDCAVAVVAENMTMLANVRDGLDV